MRSDTNFYDDDPTINNNIEQQIWRTLNFLNKDYTYHALFIRFTL